MTFFKRIFLFFSFNCFGYKTPTLIKQIFEKNYPKFFFNNGEFCFFIFNKNFFPARNPKKNRIWTAYIFVKNRPVFIGEFFISRNKVTQIDDTEIPDLIVDKNKTMEKALGYCRIFAYSNIEPETRDYIKYNRFLEIESNNLNKDKDVYQNIFDDEMSFNLWKKNLENIFQQKKIKKHNIFVLQNKEVEDLPEEICFSGFYDFNHKDQKPSLMMKKKILHPDIKKHVIELEKEFLEGKKIEIPNFLKDSLVVPPIKVDEEYKIYFFYFSMPHEVFDCDDHTVFASIITKNHIIEKFFLNKKPCC